MIAASSLRSSPHFLGDKQNIFIAKPSVAPSCVRFRRTSISAVYTSARSSTSYSNTMATASSSSLYEVLGIPTGATCQEIKSAYRKLARVCHPDVVAFDRKDTSADEFMKINAAYSTLSDPKKRADYDKTLFTRQRPLGSQYATSSATSGGFSPRYTRRRNWETDQCW